MWVPESANLIEVNFIGIDPALRDTTESYVLDDPQLPLLVFGALSYLEPGAPIEADGLTIPVPRPAGLILEKLMTERSGVKGERDLLVVLALLLVSRPADLDEVVRVFAELSDETRQTIRNNLTLLSLLEPVSGMPDPRPHRRRSRSFWRDSNRSGACADEPGRLARPDPRGARAGHGPQVGSPPSPHWRMASGIGCGGCSRSRVSCGPWTTPR